MMRQRLKGMSVATPGSSKALQEPFCRVASIMLMLKNYAIVITHILWG
nr:MAG TPA: hypothetical protein [Caudoviricetes sp.]